MTEPAQQPTTPAETPAETPGEERTFTQADLNKIAANEKREGRTSVLAELGVEDLDSLKEIVTTYNEAQAEAQSDLEKLEAERDRYKGELTAAQKLATDQAISTKLQLAYIQRGVPAEKIADALTLTDRSALSIEKGEVVGLEDAVKATLEPRSWLTEDQQQQEAPRRAADVSRQPATNADPQQQHGQFLANMLRNNST